MGDLAERYGLVVGRQNPILDRARTQLRPFAILSFPGPDDPDTACGSGIDGQAAVTSHPPAVRGLRAAFTALAGAALPPAQSAHLLTRLARQADPIPGPAAPAGDSLGH